MFFIHPFFFCSQFRKTSKRNSETVHNNPLTKNTPTKTKAKQNITMMFNSPFFLNDPYGDHQYFHNQDYSRRRRAAEEARRRSEMERYLRRQELERQEEARRRAEIERYHRQKELERQEYIKMLRKKQEQQQKENEYRRNRLRGTRQVSEPALRRHNWWGQNEDDDNAPQYALVRGADGRLYRVPVDDLENLHRHHGHSSVSTRNKTQEFNDDFSMAEHDNNDHVDEIEMQDDNEQLKNLHEKQHFNPSKSVESMSVETTERSNMQKLKKTEKSSKKKTKRVTIIVEDASDSEMEDDNMNSVWRNRRPSPGQWMEPVENDF